MITIKKISIVLLLICAFGSYRYVKTVLYDHQYTKDEVKIITIEKGMSSSEIGALLKSNNLIQSELMYKIALRMFDAQTNLKAGVYQLTTRDSYERIISTITEGVSYNEMKLTFLEGWNLRDYAQYLISKGVIQNESEWYEVVGYPASESSSQQLADNKKLIGVSSVVPVGHSLEGFLYPDTYRFFADATVAEIAQTLLQNFSTRTLELKDSKLPKDLSWYDVITLASVVVKEGRTFEEKKNVAGVFLNRINIGMGLQSDPTVNYVTLKVTDNPSLDDIAIESHYNTYKYRGLPPTPIANPAIEDIRAVLEATQHEYYYFLNTQDGKLIFSKTFEEHKQNRIKYGQ